MATLEWVTWFKAQRVLEPLGDVPPAEFEAQYDSTHTSVGVLHEISLLNSRRGASGAPRGTRLFSVDGD